MICHSNDNQGYFAGEMVYFHYKKNVHLFSMGDFSDVFINAISAILTQLDVIIVCIAILSIKCRCKLKKRWPNSVDFYGSYE